MVCLPCFPIVLLLCILHLKPVNRGEHFSTCYVGKVCCCHLQEIYPEKCQAAITRVYECSLEVAAGDFLAFCTGLKSSVMLPCIPHSGVGVTGHYTDIVCLYSIVFSRCRLCLIRGCVEWPAKGWKRTMQAQISLCGQFRTRKKGDWQDQLSTSDAWTWWRLIVYFKIHMWKHK